MSWTDQIRNWLAWSGVALLLAAAPALSQNRRDQRQSVPRPSQNQSRESRPPQRNESRQRSESRQAPAPRPQYQAPSQRPQYEGPAQSAPRPNYRTYQPPAQGHHSGQWLNQQREKPLDQQRRALENDPNFRGLPRERQQKYEQRLQRFNSMPPDRQQQVLRRMETWEHLTPQQKQDFKGIGQQFNTLPPDRRRAVRNAIETLRAMPPAAREREVESGRYSQFSPQERQILNGASRLPLAPAPSENSSPEPPNGNTQRYVPRPPQ